MLYPVDLLIYACVFFTFAHASGLYITLDLSFLVEQKLLVCSCITYESKQTCKPQQSLCVFTNSALLILSQKSRIHS